MGGWVGGEGVRKGEGSKWVRGEGGRGGSKGEGAL